MHESELTILGAGPVGSLLGSLLAEQGFEVKVFEMRDDPRNALVDSGRSINLALSHRGIRALEMAGVYEMVKPELIRMNGRMMHNREGDLTFLPYGKEDQFINSVSRAGLNKVLITHAEKKGVQFYFRHKCEGVDLAHRVATFQSSGIFSLKSKVLIGADGAFSMLRQAMQKTDRFDFSQQYIEHGYKELTLAPRGGDFALEPNYLHIWPRGSFMLIALPNPDKTFTCTLFFPFEGELSFASLDRDELVIDFFEAYFPDVVPWIPDLAGQFRQNPTSSLVSIKTFPWVKNNCLLIGDASHAIVPFYGQGMNAGFEDCRLLMEWGARMDFNWEELLPYFSSHRKADTDAISDLALRNFVEMRDKVANPRFLDIKKMEARLQERYPEIWIPLYTMVTFSDMPYGKALRLGKLQEQIMNELPEGFDPDHAPLEPVIEKFNALVRDVR